MIRRAILESFVCALFAALWGLVFFWAYVLSVYLWH